MWATMVHINIDIQEVTSLRYAAFSRVKSHSCETKGDGINTWMSFGPIDIALLITQPRNKHFALI